MCLRVTFREAFPVRGEDVQQQAMYSYLSPEQRVPVNHPLRAVRQMTDRILREMSSLFARMYARMGRPSIPPREAVEGLVAPDSLYRPQCWVHWPFRFSVGQDLHQTSIVSP